jgi:hypothetical protein
MPDAVSASVLSKQTYIKSETFDNNNHEIGDIFEK